MCGIFLCHLIMCLDSCNHHHKQDTDYYITLMLCFSTSTTNLISFSMILSFHNVTFCDWVFSFGINPLISTDLLCVFIAFLLPSTIPLYGFTIFFLTNYPLQDIWILLVWGYCKQAPINIHE